LAASIANCAVASATEAGDRGGEASGFGGSTRGGEVVGDCGSKGCLIPAKALFACPAVRMPAATVARCFKIPMASEATAFAPSIEARSAITTSTTTTVSSTAAPHRAEDG
jgi:hypothetical protein